MKTHVSKGSICIAGEFNLIYKVADIYYYLNSDDTFEYVFIPNYSVIDLTNSKYFQGIPGLNLDLRKEKYIRTNRVPVFISERVPSKSRVDYLELLKEVNMDYMDPIEFLIRCKKQYSGDKLFVVPYEDKKTFILESDTRETNASLIKKMLQNICLGNTVIIDKQKIDDGNRKMFHDVFLTLYLRSYELSKEKQKEGILKAKEEGRYKGRKPIAVDRLKFLEVLWLIEKREMTSREAAEKLKISIDKFYRYKKKLQK